MANQFEQHSYSIMVEKVVDYAIFLLDSSGVVLTWNPSAEVMKGYSKDEIVGRNFDVLYTDEGRRGGHPKHNLKMAVEQGSFQEEAWRRRKDGSVFWALIEVIAIVEETGLLSGFCKLTRDISARKRMEEALRDADRRKDEFLAMLAHELRNPLAPVSAAAELLSLNKLDAESVKKASQVIIRQVTHMTGLVDDLLDVSRVSRGLVRLNMASVDMKIVVGHALEQVRPLIESRAHTVSLKLSPGRAHVRGDEKRLIQVVSNLLNNAAKYTEPGGEISVVLAASASEVCITVLDNGLGIDPRLQPIIFEMFEQVQRTSDRTKGGLGIGLALVRNLVALHEGTVTCQSDGLGFGSRFTMCIPMLESAEPVPERRSIERIVELPRIASGATILLVDDNVDAAEMLQFFLVTAGYVVTLAHSVKEALDEVRSTVPDICILDIGLPDGNGYDLAVSIRDLVTGPLTLIALTGYGTDEDRNRGAHAGFKHYFVKPVNFGELNEALEAAAAELKKQTIDPMARRFGDSADSQLGLSTVTLHR